MATSTWIQNVTNATLNASVSTFSFQNALSIANNYPFSPFLFETGCILDDKSQNCTAACLDPTQIFGSLDTLHNCMVYPTVADLYARGNLSQVDLARRLSIQRSRTESPLYINTTTIIRQCLIDFCGTLRGCSQALEGFDTSYSPYNINSTFYIYSDATYADASGVSKYTNSGLEYVNDVFDFCDYVPKSFNPDIGGIGVCFLLR